MHFADFHTSEGTSFSKDCDCIQNHYNLLTKSNDYKTQAIVPLSIITPQNAFLGAVDVMVEVGEIAAMAAVWSSPDIHDDGNQRTL